MFHQQPAGYKAPLNHSLVEQARFALKPCKLSGTGCTLPLTVRCVPQMSSSEEFLHHFGLRLAQLIAPSTSRQAVQQAIQQTLSEAATNGAAAPTQQAGKDHRDLELMFVHDCR